MTKRSPLIILTAQRPWVYRKYPPFGILYLADSLLKAGFRVKIVHPVEGRREAVLSAVREERPLFVGLSVIATPLLAEDIEISKAVHAEGVPVVWGGIYPSMVPETALSADYVDYILTGEAELTVLDFARALNEGQDPEGIPGAGHKGDGLAVNPPGAFHRDLDRFRPAWELINLPEYLEFFPASGELMMMLSLSRGCPHRCIFCYNQSNPERRRFRIHGADYLREQVDYFKQKYRINLVRWVSDNPFGKVDKGKEVIMAADIPWVSTARIDLVDRQFAKWLKDSGCRFLCFGFESGVDHVLKILRKGFTSEQIRTGLMNLNNEGIFASGGWMHLIPGESEDDRRQTRQFMDELHRMSPRVLHDIQGLRPYPDTPVWKMCLEMGLTPPTTNEEWTQYRWLAAPLFGWTEKRLRRLVLATRILYGRARKAAPAVTTGQHEVLRERFIKGLFPGPVEEQMSEWPSLKNKIADPSEQD